MTAPSPSLSTLFQWVRPHKKYVYYFSEGNSEDKMLLSNKGANICEMFRLGFPVPPGFIISSEASLEFLKSASTTLNPEVVHEYTQAIHEIEKQSNKYFAVDSETTSKRNELEGMPLLLSVRAGSGVVMPGILDTILNLGINDQVVKRLANITNNPKWAFDTYRIFIQNFGRIVYNVSHERYEEILTKYKEKKGVQTTNQLDLDDLINIVHEFKEFTDIPENCWDQLSLAIQALYISWNSPRAIKFRDIHNIPFELGLSVVLQSMVYGNMNQMSGCGVAFSRNPISGEDEVYGEYLDTATGEEFERCERKPFHLKALQDQNYSAFETLLKVEKKLERYYRDVQVVEFVIENGILFILQSHLAKKTPRAAVKIASWMIREKMITEREALVRLDANKMDYFLYPIIDQKEDNQQEIESKLMGQGIAASGGAIHGVLVFTKEEAELQKDLGNNVILCRQSVTSEDFLLLQVIDGLFTALGGLSSYAAIMMKEFGKTAITGARDLMIDSGKKEVYNFDRKIVLRVGDKITIDGTTGKVYEGFIPTTIEGVTEDFQKIVSAAEKYKNMYVFANADTKEEIQFALDLGAEGIGLCRVEKMLKKNHRINLLRKYMLSLNNPIVQESCCEQLEKIQTQEISEILNILHNRSITFRLLDSPFEEFLPNPLDNNFEDQLFKLSGKVDMSVDECRANILELQQINPEMGFRGCRVGIIHPDLIEMQAKSIIKAAVQARKNGIFPIVKILIPMVFSDHELDFITPIITDVLEKECAKEGYQTEEIYLHIGAMIETPRACLRADKIAATKNIQFLLFGGNDLTQLVFGMSQADTHSYLPYYLGKHLIAKDPFQSLDQHGVGALIHLALKKAKEKNPNIKIGLAGDHSSDPTSIKIINQEGFDYLSTSPFLITNAKIAAAQAQIENIAHHEKHDWLLTPLVLNPMFPVWPVM